MKSKLSVTLDEELVAERAKALSTGKFRNKTHVVEFAVKKLLEENSPQASGIRPPTSPTHTEVQNG